jgi:hypothetical protein
MQLETTFVAFPAPWSQTSSALVQNRNYPVS